MTKFKTKLNFNDFKKTVESMCRIYDELSLNVTKEGLSAIHMDSSHVALAELTIKAENMENYKCEEEGNVTIDLTYLKKFLKELKKLKSGSIIMKTNNEKDLIDFQIVMDQRIVSFSCPTFKRSSENLKIPKEINWANVIVFDGKELKDAVDFSKITNNHTSFEVFQNNVQISAKGDTTRNYIELHKHGDNHKVTYEAFEKPSKSTFNTGYLVDILKEVKNQDVTAYLDSDVPIKLEYKIGAFELRYLLAPRVE